MLKSVSRIAKNLVLVILASLAGLLALEALMASYIWISGRDLPVVHSTYPGSPDRVEKQDPRLGWSLKANYAAEIGRRTPSGHKMTEAIATNEDGLRTSVSDLSTFCENREAVLLVGDSVVYGYGVDQDNIFSEILNENQPKYCFINTGVIGYSTSQEIIALSEHLEQFDISTILWFFTQANDLWGNAHGGYFMPYFRLVDDELKMFPPNTEVDVPLYKHSHFYRFFYQQTSGKDLLYYYYRVEFMLFGAESTVWRVTAALLEELAGVVEREGIRLVMVDVPSIGSLERGAANHGDGTGAAVDEVRWSMGNRYALLKAKTQQLGVEYVPIWNHYPADFRSIFLPGDSHWNEEGHELVACMVLELLSEGEAAGRRDAFGCPLGPEVVSEAR